MFTMCCRISLRTVSISIPSNVCPQKSRSASVIYLKDIARIYQDIFCYRFYEVSNELSLPLTKTNLVPIVGCSETTTCTTHCPHGHGVQWNGCLDCSLCNPPPVCPPCHLPCPLKSGTDSDGCPVCECTEPPHPCHVCTFIGHRVTLHIQNISNQ